MDYSNTIIYKITCNDPNITDKYVGHTTNFIRRKYSHKHTVQNEKSRCFNIKLYKAIRDNGGWENWRMDIIQVYDCKNLYEARKKEQEHYINLKASLNSVEPLKCVNSETIDVAPVNKSSKVFKKFNCRKCDFTCEKLSNWNMHIKTNKHKIRAPSPSFECEQCNYTASTKSLLNKHLEQCAF